MMLVVVLVVPACVGGGNHAKVPNPTTRPVSAPHPTLPPVTEIARPDGVVNDGYQWYLYPPSGGAQLLLAVRRSTDIGRHPAVLLADTSGGFNLDYLTFADELVARGFDAAVGCLFTPPVPLEPGSGRIPCATAPPFDGVADTMVADLDLLVDAAYRALGPSTRLALMGFSRGAAIAALRASVGRPEPVLLASGRYNGWNSTTDPEPDGTVNVVDRVSGWRAPALILHGTSDGAAPVSQSYELEAALRAAGDDVESHYYEGAGHNLAGEPGVRDDLVNRVTRFLCARLTCSGA